MSGKSVKDIPIAVQEFVMAEVFGWSLEYIRDLSIKDYKTLLSMALNKFTVDCQKIM